ncbi:hypothetical protein INT08_06665 [Prosthecochloris sp. N3]|uniref:Uncharacterized protein n=1 Tax=Prosthecochloris ethylica TaxID=2743976 RepID=A0ABR9XSD0_9CHLB|nr:hypothetical protein [Prosthecochloris ethylica]MBF0585317.1 hypothetical protein [Prosthecochloris ethylica]MBF0636853.1 hypothetical protein [Prosthecochloris ethylica]NUK46546.1 hypothetical protein [Prosthecochloris ethylica]
MNKFSTEFPIKGEYSIDDVLNLACEWISGSPHSGFCADDLNRLLVKNDDKLEEDNESVEVGRVELDAFVLGGLRYIKSEGDGLIWTSTIVSKKDDDVHLVNISVECEAINPSVRLPFPKKPYLIKLLIERFGGGNDGHISVLDKPHYFSEFDYNYASDVIYGKCLNGLPSVYVSADFSDGYVLDPAKLARDLSGIAHVFVEPNRGFSYKVKSLTRSRNVYGGTVGVYWPEGFEKRGYYHDTEESSDSIYRKIVKDVSSAVSNRRSEKSCDWLFLRECIVKNKYEELKADGSAELNDFVNAFDEEVKLYKQRLSDAEQEIQRLRGESYAIKKYSVDDDLSLFNLGNEQEFYKSEALGFVLDLLRDALKNIPEETRKYHLIRDIVDSNSSDGMAVEMREKIKAMFKTYDGMNAKIRNELSRMGFDVTEDGKHYKLVFKGDGRYTFSVSKTSGDHRSGKNLASKINQKLF